MKKLKRLDIRNPATKGMYPGSGLPRGAVLRWLNAQFLRVRSIDDKANDRNWSNSTSSKIPLSPPQQDLVWLPLEGISTKAPRVSHEHEKAMSTPIVQKKKWMHSRTQGPLTNKSTILFLRLSWNEVRRRVSTSIQTKLAQIGWRMSAELACIRKELDGQRATAGAVVDRSYVENGGSSVNLVPEFKRG